MNIKKQVKLENGAAAIPGATGPTLTISILHFLLTFRP